MKNTWVDRERHGVGLDLAQGTHCTQFLADHVRGCMAARPNRRAVTSRSFLGYVVEPLAGEVRFGPK